MEEYHKTMRLETLADNEIVAVLLALSLLLLFAYGVGNFFEKIKAPRVVGEITGGILLGGTFLYAIAPDFITFIFMQFEQEGKVLNLFYHLGLIFLMFLSGYNTQLKIDRKDGKNLVFLFIGATILPMVAAIPFASFFKNYFIGMENNEFSFYLVFIIGVAITSIPVISKIFFDIGIMNTKFSNTVLVVATVQDLFLCIMLNIATRSVTLGKIDLIDMIVTVCVTLGLFVFVRIIEDKAKKIKCNIKTAYFYQISFVILMSVCSLLSLIGINTMYAAFFVGYVIKVFVGEDEITKKRMESLGDFSFSFFVPIYFALVGIQLNLLNGFSFLRFGLFFIIAFGLEAFGTILMLQYTKYNTKSRINFAVTMNARGGPGIVLATVAYSYEIINVEFFTVLILTTMLSSMIAGYWLRFQQKNDSQIFMNIYKR